MKSLERDEVREVTNDKFTSIYSIAEVKEAFISPEVEEGEGGSKPDTACGKTDRGGYYILHRGDGINILPYYV